jgi:hypothetical protein
MQTIQRPAVESRPTSVSPSSQPPQGGKKKKTVAAAVAAALVVAGTGAAIAATSSASSSVHTLSLTATEYTFSGPSIVKAGLTKVTLHDGGLLAHQADLLKVNPGVAVAAVEAGLRKSPNGFAGLATPYGGPGGILSGQDATAWVNLTAGSYVITCFLRGGGATGPNHAMLGMVKALQVTGSAPVTVKAPAVAGQVVLSDHSLSLPAGFGRGRYQVTNAGTQVHELDLLALTPGKTVGDFLGYLREAETGKLPHGPAAAPPFKNAGGFASVVPGRGGWFSLNLPAGTYVATDFIPNVHTGIPDVVEGMRATFTVK